MKYLMTVLLMVVGSIPVLKQTNAEPGSRRALVGVPRAARLQLTTTAIKSRSCSANRVSLDLRFTFRNVGEQPVIIDRRSFVARSLVSRSLKSAVAKVYVAEAHADLFDDSFPVYPTDMSSFLIVQAGEVADLQTEQTRASFLIDDGMPQSKDYLHPGSYVLQIEVATWPYLADPAPFRRQWKDKGYLWFEGITSEPMPFTISKSRQIIQCR